MNEILIVETLRYLLPPLDIQKVLRKLIVEVVFPLVTLFVKVN